MRVAPLRRWIGSAKLPSQGLATTSREAATTWRSSRRGLDAELHEGLAQVVLDGPGADEQPAPDLGVGRALGGEAGDLRLLGREGVARVDRALPHRLASGQELPASPFGEGGGAHALEHLVGAVEFLPSVDATVLPPEPLPEDGMGAGQVGLDACALKPLDRLAIERLGAAVIAEQRSRSGQRTQGPLGRRSDGPLLELLERFGGVSKRAGAGAGLDALDEVAPVEAEVVVLALHAGPQRRRRRSGPDQ